MNQNIPTAHAEEGALIAVLLGYLASAKEGS